VLGCVLGEPDDGETYSNLFISSHYPLNCRQHKLDDKGNSLLLVMDNLGQDYEDKVR